jgi:hypothetical protein
MRYLARWEKLECDWDAIEAEIKNTGDCGSKIEIKRTPEHVVLDMWIDGNILDYPSLGGAVANNCYCVVEQVNINKRHAGVPSLPSNTWVQWDTARHIGPRHHYHVSLLVWVAEYCQHTHRAYVLKDNTEVLPPIVPRPRCWWFQHDWELIPDIVRTTGFHFFFFSSGIQKGIWRCKTCDKRKLVYREGLVGAGFDGGWETCSQEQEQYIDQLPRL